MQLRVRCFQAWVAAKYVRSSAQHLLPRFQAEVELGGSVDGLGRFFAGKIDQIIFHFHVFQRRLFFGKTAQGGLVGLVGREPELAAQRHFIVVRGHDFYGAQAFAEVAVLFVVADTNYYADEPSGIVRIIAKRAQDGVGRIVMNVRDLIVDVIRTLELSKLEFFLRTPQLREHGLEQGIAIVIGGDGRSPSGSIVRREGDG